MKEHYKKIRKITYCKICKQDAWSNSHQLDMFEDWVDSLNDLNKKPSSLLKQPNRPTITAKMLLMFYVLHKVKFDIDHSGWETIDRIYTSIFRTIHITLESSPKPTRLLEILTKLNPVSENDLRPVLPPTCQLSLNKIAKYINRYQGNDYVHLLPPFIRAVIDNNDISWLFNLTDQDERPPFGITYRYKDGTLFTDGL